MTFNDMVKKQKNNELKKDYADLNMFDDIGSLAYACADELDSIQELFGEETPATVNFKVSPQEYYQKLLECKQTADWLVENISRERRY